MTKVKEIARIVAGGYEDHQEVRLAEMNRIRDLVRKLNEGIPFDQVEEKKEEKTFAKEYADKHLPSTIKKMLEEGKIDKHEFEYLSKMLELAMQALNLEKNYAKVMGKFIVPEPIWQEFFSQVKGIGPTISCQLLKEFGYFETFETVSAVWKVSGLDVRNGEAPKRTKGEKLDFSPRKKVLAWKIAESLIKHRSPIYKDIYDSDKARQLAREDDNKPASLLHAHNRARRKVSKLFLSHYWEAARTIKELPTRKTYVEEKLGHKDIISYTDIIKANQTA